MLTESCVNYFCRPEQFKASFCEHKTHLTFHHIPSFFRSCNRCSRVGFVSFLVKFSFLQFEGNFTSIGSVERTEFS